MKNGKFLTLLAVAAVMALVAWTLAACNDIDNGRDGVWNDWGAGGGGQQNAPPATDDDSGQATGCDTSSSPTWTNFGQCFMDAYCTRCHVVGGSAPTPLDTLESVKQQAEHVKEHVVSGEMPPSPPLPSDAEINLLVAWIDAGLPQ